MSDTDNRTPVEIYSGTWMDAEMIKTFLVDQGIEVYLNDSYMGALAPWNASGGGASPVRIMVPGAHAERAAHLVSQFEANRHNG